MDLSDAVGERRTAFLVACGYLGEMIRGGGRPLVVAFDAVQSLAHVVESVGIPRLEIGAVRIGGQEWSLHLPVPDGAVVELLPLREPLELSGTPRFVVDVHLGRLARQLRLLGFDVAWRNDYDDAVIVELSIAEGRIVLTRDRALLFRREFQGDPRLAMLVRSREPWNQLIGVCRRFGLASHLRPFSLCAACGAALVPAERDEVLPLLPPIVAGRYDEFFRCPACGKPYWKGDHFRSIGPFLERLGRELGRGGA